MLVDIREPKLFTLGHIVNTINVLMSSFDNLTILAEVNKDRNLIVVDADGKRARAL